MLEEHTYDLGIFDQHLDEDATGMDCVRYGRGLGQQGIFVGYSGDAMEEEHKLAGCDVSWMKPSPSRTQMQRELRKAWLNRQRVSNVEVS